MQRLTAPAKLTVSLRVIGTRSDGFHLLDAEMVTLDLADVLEVTEGSDRGVEVVDEVVGGLGLGSLDPGGHAAGHRGPGSENLVERALAAVGRRASVRLHKRIPVGAGLGGGSADAAAVLRWAGCRDLELAASVGADVPFCVVGGRARVRGIGEDVEPLAFEDRAFVLVLPPLAVDTGAVYRAWDAGARPVPDAFSRETAVNDLEVAALAVEPALAGWRDALAGACGRPARLAGSGAAWFVEADEELVGLARVGGIGDGVTVDGARAPLLVVRTVRAPGPEGAVRPG